MKNIYQIFDVKQPNGTWFKKFVVPDELDLPHNYVSIDPPETLKNPRYIFGTGWVEDDEGLIEMLKQENEELRQRMDMSDEALLELADMVLAATEAMKGGM